MGTAQTRRAMVATTVIAAVTVCVLAGCGDGAATEPSGDGRASTGSLVSLAFSADGRTLASVGLNEGTIRLWDVPTRKSLGAPLTAEFALNAIAFLPRGHTLVYATGSEIRLFDARARKQVALLRGHGSAVFGLALSGDGRTLASTDHAESIRLWSVRRHQQIGAPLLIGDAEAVALSPDGRTLAYLATSYAKAVGLLDTRTRKRLRPSLRGDNLEVYRVSFSRDGRTVLANGLYDGSRLWDLRTHKQIGPALPGDDESSAVLSPDGRTAAYTDGDAVRLLDIATREPVGAPFTVHSGGVGSLAFSRDGRLLASGGVDKTIRLWDVLTGKSLGAMG